MAAICRSCALRVARNTATLATKRQVQYRAFSQTVAARRHGALPQFDETSNEELDNVLSELRNKHFVPAYLNNRQRNLIFKEKYKTELENAPAYATLGGEDIKLEHIDRIRDVTGYRNLVNNAISYAQEPEDWAQLPAVLEGLHTAKQTVKGHLLAKLVRKTVEAGQARVIIRCLHRAEKTGVTLKDNDEILQYILWGIHHQAQTGGWVEKNVQKAARLSSEVAQLLEDERHGTGRHLSENDPRTRPQVIGVFLELAAVNGYRYTGRNDADGSVKKYAERLMANFQGGQLPTQKVPSRGFQTEFNAKFPIWQGLLLASKVLGSSMPKAQEAQSILQEYGTRLQEIVDSLDSGAQPGSYHAQALEAWNARIMD